MAELVATLKAGKDFNAPWLVLHAESPTELSQLLDYTSGDLLAKVQSVANQFQGFANAAPLAPPAGVTQQAAPPQPAPQAIPAPAPQQQAQAATPAPGPQADYPEGSFFGDGWMYQHPENELSSCCNLVIWWRDFTSSKGNKVRGYFCPGPGREHQKPQYAR